MVISGEGCYAGDYNLNLTTSAAQGRRSVPAFHL